MSVCNVAPVRLAGAPGHSDPASEKDLLLRAVRNSFKGFGRAAVMQKAVRGSLITILVSGCAAQACVVCRFASQRGSKRYDLALWWLPLPRAELAAEKLSNHLEISQKSYPYLFRSCCYF